MAPRGSRSAPAYEGPTTWGRTARIKSPRADREPAGLRAIWGQRDGVAIREGKWRGGERKLGAMRIAMRGRTTHLLQGVDQEGVRAGPGEHGPQAEDPRPRGSDARRRGAAECGEGHEGARLEVGGAEGAGGPAEERHGRGPHPRGVLARQPRLQAVPGLPGQEDGGKGWVARERTLSLGGM